MKFKKENFVFRFITSLLITSLLGTQLVHAATIDLPAVGTLIDMSSIDKKSPLLKGIRISPDNPLDFQFIVDARNSEDLSDSQVEKLIKYFMAALTIPQEDLWVNLSPYENDRVSTDTLSLTDLGKDLLEQDYILKQLSSSLTHPDTELGQEYWKQMQNASNAFNKIWIMPDLAEVYEKGDSAYISKASLKVMTEADYKASLNNSSDLDSNVSSVINDVLLPNITEDVNEGENFTELRQIYHSIILGLWFKERFMESAFKDYINQNKVAGIDIEDKSTKEKIFQQYVDSFKTGVYNLTKKEYDLNSNRKVKKNYFSGGATMHKIERTAGSPLGVLESMIKPFIVNVSIKAKMAPKNSIEAKIVAVNKQLAKLYRQRKALLNSLRHKHSHKHDKVSELGFKIKRLERNLNKLRHEQKINSNDDITVEQLNEAVSEIMNMEDGTNVVLITNTEFEDSVDATVDFLNSGRSDIIALKGPKGVFSEFYFDGHPKAVNIDRKIVESAGITVPVNGILDPWAIGDDAKAVLKAKIKDELKAKAGLPLEEVEYLESNKFRTLSQLDAKKVQISDEPLIFNEGKHAYANFHILDLTVLDKFGVEQVVRTYQNSPIITDECEIVGVGPETMKVWGRIIERAGAVIVLGDETGIESILAKPIYQQERIAVSTEQVAELNFNNSSSSLNNSEKKNKVIPEGVNIREQLENAMHDVIQIAKDQAKEAEGNIPQWEIKNNILSFVGRAQKAVEVLDELDSNDLKKSLDERVSAYEEYERRTDDGPDGDFYETLSAMRLLKSKLAIIDNAKAVQNAIDSNDYEAFKKAFAYTVNLSLPPFGEPFLLGEIYRKSHTYDWVEINHNDWKTRYYSSSFNNTLEEIQDSIARAMENLEKAKEKFASDKTYANYSELKQVEASIERYKQLYDVKKTLFEANKAKVKKLFFSRDKFIFAGVYVKNVWGTENPDADITDNLVDVGSEVNESGLVTEFQFTNRSIEAMKTFRANNADSLMTIGDIASFDDAITALGLNPDIIMIKKLLPEQELKTILNDAKDTVVIVAVEDEQELTEALSLGVDGVKIKPFAKTDEDLSKNIALIEKYKAMYPNVIFGGAGGVSQDNLNKIYSNSNVDFIGSGMNAKSGIADTQSQIAWLLNETDNTSSSSSLGQFVRNFQVTNAIKNLSHDKEEDLRKGLESVMTKAKSYENIQATISHLLEKNVNKELVMRMQYFFNGKLAKEYLNKRYSMVDNKYVDTTSKSEFGDYAAVPQFKILQAIIDNDLNYLQNILFDGFISAEYDVADIDKLTKKEQYQLKMSAYRDLYNLFIELFQAEFLDRKFYELLKEIELPNVNDLIASVAEANAESWEVSHDENDTSMKITYSDRYEKYIWTRDENAILIKRYHPSYNGDAYVRFSHDSVTLETESIRANMDGWAPSSNIKVPARAALVDLIVDQENITAVVTDYFMNYYNQEVNSITPGPYYTFEADKLPLKLISESEYKKTQSSSAVGGIDWKEMTVSSAVGSSKIEFKGLNLADADGLSFTITSKSRLDDVQLAKLVN